MPSLHEVTNRSSLLINPIQRIFLLLLLLASFLLAPAIPAQAKPQLWLPTPVGEEWKIIQGYNCGTHTSWDYYSLDLISVNGYGDTYDAPVRAAADGYIWAWTPGSGSLILSHGNGYYTMYTHMATVVTTQKGLFVERGTVVGTVGDRATVGVPHLHFTFFSGQGVSASNRKPLPLSFAEGYDLPDVGGCNQHNGKVMVASGEAAPAEPPHVEFDGGEPERWYNEDLRIDFEGQVAGFSQSWDQEPVSAEPEFKDTDAGYAQLSWAEQEGLHTFYVRAWGTDGSQQVFSYGPFGYDVTPPELPEKQAEAVEIAANTTGVFTWDASIDNASGVAGYRVYIGADPRGKSEWYTETPQVDIPELNPGEYTVRVQAIDFAGNRSNWGTVGTIISVAPEE